MSGSSRLRNQTFEYGAVLQHRPRGNAGDVGAPARLVICGRDEDRGRWLAVDPDFNLVSVWDGTAWMYQRIAPGGFPRASTVAASGRRKWARALAGRVPMRR